MRREENGEMRGWRSGGSEGEESVGSGEGSRVRREESGEMRGWRSGGRGRRV